MVNWDAVGVISAVVSAGTAGLYAAIRNAGHDTRDEIQSQVENVRGELSGKMDAVGETLKTHGAHIDDARTRVARIEGRLGLDGEGAPLRP